MTRANIGGPGTVGVSAKARVPEARLDHLDMLRGMAALLVLAGHLRAFVFTTYAENPAAVGTILTKAFYFATSLGYLAVLAFFALSGFLVGGKALGDMLDGRHQWTGYLSRRLTRLWIVILPALVLTFVFDQIGMSLTGGVGYDGRYYEILNSGPRPTTGVAHAAFTFVGNLAYVQNIAVPIFGSNGPLWSLANEFWYYIIFPLTAWLLLARVAVAIRLRALAILILLVAWLPGALLEGGVIWLAGAVAAWSAGRKQHAAFWKNNVVRVLSMLLLAAAIAATKMPRLGFSDIPFGLTTAAVLPALALMPSPGALYRLLARALSELSYTLYLTHFPLLMLVSLLWIGPTRYAPGIDGAVVYVAMLVAAIVWAALIWWCFERQTDRLYRCVRRQLGTCAREEPDPRSL